jgi:hypothetical protein
MPKLPSGQQITFDFMPLRVMLQTWHLDESLQALSAISKSDGLEF